MKPSLLGTIAAGSTALASVANASFTGATAYSTMPYTRTEGTRIIPWGMETDNWKSWEWFDGLGNSFLLAFDITSINAPLTSATNAYAKLNLNGQTYTTGGAALTDIVKPISPDNTFSGAFTPVNGGSQIQWFVTPPTTWSDFTVQGFINALSCNGAEIYAAPDTNLSSLFSTTNTPTMLNEAPDGVPAPGTAAALLGAGLMAGALRRRRTAIEVENS